jgi:hypothetical protein
MENFYAMAQFVGETTDVTCWLSRAGLKFEDLGNDPASKAIRKQWREYQAAVQRCCATTGLVPEQIQLSGVYAKLRVPQINYEATNLKEWILRLD